MTTNGSCFVFERRFFSIFLVFCFKKRFFTFGQVKGNARYGRSRHRPTKVFEFCKANHAILKVAINLRFRSPLPRGKVCTCSKSFVDKRRTKHAQKSLKSPSKINFSCTPQATPGHRTNCQIPWRKKQCPTSQCEQRGQQSTRDPRSIFK